MSRPHSHTSVPRSGLTPSSTPLASHELWSLSGASLAVRGLVIETSFGYALGVELDRELILLSLQPSYEVLQAYAERLRDALLASGWSGLPTSSSSKEHP